MFTGTLCIQNMEAKWRQVLCNRADMSICTNIHCKLHPIKLWSIIKENPGSRTILNRFIIHVYHNKILTCIYCSVVCLSWKKETTSWKACKILYMNTSFWLAGHWYLILRFLCRILNISFEQITYDKWTHVMNFVSKHLCKLWHLFLTDCRPILIDNFYFF